MREIALADQRWKRCVIERVGQLPSIIAFSPKRQSLVIKHPGGRHVSLPVVDPARGFERAGASFGVLLALGHGQDPRQACLRLLEVASHLPETPERRRQSHRSLGVALRYTPVQCSPKVVVVQLQAIEPDLLLFAKQIRRGLHRQRAKGIGMTVPHLRLLATQLQALACELSNGLQHEEPWFVKVRKSP